MVLPRLIHDVLQLGVLVCLVVFGWPLIVAYLLLARFGGDRKRVATVVRVGENLAARGVSLPSARSFSPVWWLSGPLGGHLQTVATLARRVPSGRWYDRRSALAVDSAVIGLWWREGVVPRPSSSSSSSEDAPFVVVFPGLTGDAKSAYAVSAISRFASAGYRICLACPRGCGDSTLGTRPYNARNANDLCATLLHVRESYPRAPIYAIGFSLGANLLVNCLSDHAEELSFLAGAVVVCSPFDLTRSRHVTTRGISGLVFGPNLSRGLVDYYHRNLEALRKFPGLVDSPDRLSVGSVPEFDALVTCKAANYPSVEHYYRDASSHERFEDIRVPILAVSALDDPIIAGETIPIYTSHNPNAMLVLSEKGGHLGFVDEKGLNDVWIDRVALEFFEELERTRNDK